jgi:hypothetical protein
MSENKVPNNPETAEHTKHLDDIIERALTADYNIEQYQRKPVWSGAWKTIGVLVLWFGFWGILSVI